MGTVVSLAEAQTYPEGQERDWLYNALDVTGTLEVAHTLLPRLDPQTARTYAFERACCAPALEMMLRGCRIDGFAVGEALGELKRDLRKQVSALNKHPLVAAKWDATELETGKCPQREGKRHKWPRGVPDSPERRCEVCGASRLRPSAFNPASPKQVGKLLHDLHGIPPMKNKKGDYSWDEEVLERVGRKFPEMFPLTEAMLEIRGTKKQIGFLGSRRSPDGRMRYSMNVAAAWTGRFSGSKNPYHDGTNPQNIAERHRNIFVSDPGYDIAYADLERAESCVVAHVSGDEAYIEAHKGDTHTFVARLLWPELDWTGDPVVDKKVAKASPPWDDAPGHDYRFQAKRIQHGSNYGLSPGGISSIAHIPLREAKKAWYRYFDSFPFIKAWQESVARSVAEQRPLENPLGRRCALFGRPWDGHTVRQGLAFIPQSTVADILNLSLWRVWHDLDPHTVQLLAQVHDAILFQFPCGNMEALKAVKERMTVPVLVRDPKGTERQMQIAVEVAAGKNWKKADESNPRGIKVVEL
jgi:DNA polymerase family A